MSIKAIASCSRDRIFKGIATKLCCDTGHKYFTKAPDFLHKEHMTVVVGKAAIILVYV